MFVKVRENAIEIISSYLRHEFKYMLVVVHNDEDQIM